MSKRLSRKRIAGLPSPPQQKLAWADARMDRLRNDAILAMRALAESLESTASRLEAGTIEPGDHITEFAAEADAIDRMSFEMLFTRQIGEELRAAGFSPETPTPAVPRPSRQVALPVEPAPRPIRNTGQTQSSIDALVAEHGRSY